MLKASLCAHNRFFVHICSVKLWPAIIKASTVFPNQLFRKIILRRFSIYDVIKLRGITHFVLTTDNEYTTNVVGYKFTPSATWTIHFADSLLVQTAIFPGDANEQTDFKCSAPETSTRLTGIGSKTFLRTSIPKIFVLCEIPTKISLPEWKEVPKI